MTRQPLPALPAQATHARPVAPQCFIERGIALPVVLILLMAIALAGLLAARRSATVEEITNDTRLIHVARLAAESALRYCEAVVIDTVESGAVYAAGVKNMVGNSAPLTTPADATARWSTLANWIPGTASLIQVPRQDSSASVVLSNAPPPYCMAETMANGRYLITARGLSAGAAIDPNNGRLVDNAGSEVWLQSILSPSIPVRATGAGYE
jgi:Tfp pilus assembly protein PilX